MQYSIHRSQNRGGADHGWLNTKHSFSFAHYFNPYRMGFGALRVINEDVVAPKTGFPNHPHRNMEIITIVKEGALRHQDSTGNSGIIPVGEIQRMSAGSGIFHSEYNHSSTDRVHFFQVWIDTKENEIIPDYEQNNYQYHEIRNKLFPIVSGFDNRSDNTLYIHQNAEILLGNLDEDIKVNHTIRNPNNGIYVQVVKGKLEFGNDILNAGDGLQITETDNLKLKSLNSSEIIVFDVPI